jgi:hypothetical protein
MQYRKCVALFTAILVGFGVVAVDAASVNSVTIISPADSGTLRGIDSTFQVQAKLLDFTPNDSLEVIFYLVTTNDSTVVADSQNLVSAGSRALASVIGKAIKTTAGVAQKVRTSSGLTLNSVDAGTRASIGGQGAGDEGGLIAVRATRGLALASPRGFQGDADSVRAVTSANADTTTFTWYGRIHFSSGTVTGIRAAAISIDGTATNTLTDTTTPTLSATSLKINVDADRPANPDQMIFTTSALARRSRVGSPNRTVTGLANGAANDVVLGINDTLALDVKLGTQTDGVLIGDTLNVVADAFGKAFAVSKSARSSDTLKWRHIIADGDFGDFIGTQSSVASDTLGVYLVDLAGNRSSSSDGVAGGQGVTLGVTFFVDAKKPVLDGQVTAGDTILPVNNDTITDGTLHTGFADDLNPITYNLPEALDTLFVTIGSTTLKVHQKGNASVATTNVLAKSRTRRIDFTSVGNDKDTASGHDSLFVALTDGTTDLTTFGGSLAGVQDVVLGATIGDSTIATGVHTLKFKGQDLAGNIGPVLSRTGIYVDVDDITLARLFPTAASGLDTLEENTAKIVFRLSEHADSVLISYTGIAGNDNGKTRTRPLVGSELTNITSEQTFTVDSLQSNSLYTLQLVAADLTGNYTQTSLDTFVYDTTFVVPVISTFTIAASSSGFGSPVLAGSSVTLTLKARTAANAAAVTYKEVAVLKLSGGSGLKISGTGVDTAGLASGRATLSADDWIVGERTVTIIDTTSIDTISVTVQDCTDTTNLYIGSLDSSIIVNPAAYQKIALAADDTVGQGDNFWVGVTLADKFGNTRTKDNRFVEITTTALGVQHPVGAVAVTAGLGGFWANSQGYAGNLTLTVRDIVDTVKATTQDVLGNQFTYGTLSVYVDGDGSTVLAGVDTLIGQDYMGASGGGDQGGFVLLTFPASADHSTLTGYRIYRDISVDYAADSTGALVALAEPTTALVPWGRVDAVPGEAVMRVVVATLDGDSTSYGVAAERGNLTNKEAFEATDAVSTAYELMAETMLQSKELAQVDPQAPVFATLTPEALAFSVEGVVPRLKSVDGVLLSNIRESETVKAIDNIAPAAVPFMQAMDTQGDAGGSITVQWAKSADDKMLTTTVPNAVGGVNTYTTVGVEGYNIYRKLGDAAWQLVGQAGAGETSFEDATVFNGVRYSFKVEARDADNVTTSEFEKSAMAIRNNVVDANGQRIAGLFGADARVDYDDFFIFADHFGLTAGTETYDSAFDLSPNNAVDFDDFFVFADNFGREMVGVGKVVPTMTGLNSDARYYLEAGTELSRIGEELSVAVSLEDFIEVRGYGLTVEFDNQLLEFVEPQVVDNLLGETDLAAPQVFAQEDGKIAIVAFGNAVSEGGLGLNLVFRTKQEIEGSYIELTNGTLQDGTYGLNQITTPVSVRIETRPEAYALRDNYPNPFNPETTIKYQLPEAGQVRLEVYNMLGQAVKTLVDNQFQNAGRYTLQWDATNNSGQPLSSGVYFYRILAGGEYQSHKKMLLLK